MEMTWALASQQVTSLNTNLSFNSFREPIVHLSTVHCTHGDRRPNNQMRTPCAFWKEQVKPKSPIQVSWKWEEYSLPPTSSFQLSCLIQTSRVTFILFPVSKPNQHSCIQSKFSQHYLLLFPSGLRNALQQWSVYGSWASLAVELSEWLALSSPVIICR